MKVTTHLISAPWSALNYPSMQLGALKAYLDQVFKHRTRTLAYSAFLGIAYEWKQNLAFEACQEWRQHEELPYLLLFQRRFLRSKAKTPLPANELALLDQATTAYIDREILPNLAESGVNVIGFTLNYHQTYASLFFERYLRERAGNKKLLFLYGGYGAYAKSFEKTLRQIDAGGYVVVGEGEKKLELVIEYLLGLAEGAPIGLPDIAGVIPSRPAGAGLRTQTSERDFSSQFKDLSSLPVPDFDEYFGLLHQLRRGDPIFGLYKNEALLLEGTRGCFAHCDFCTLNAQWRGFRKLPAELVFERATALMRKHRTSRVQFVDNVCDTWAEKFSELVIENDLPMTFFMELRAHHPEKFWTKLATAGLWAAQIGIEALSSELLIKIGKGTRVIQNLMAQKYLCELGVSSQSNLITHHPKSTLADIEETKRVLLATPHFPELNLCHFRLGEESPIFEALSAEEKSNLKLFSDGKIAGQLPEFASDWGYELPESLKLSPELHEAWDEFLHWYKTVYRRAISEKTHLTVKRRSEGRLTVTDARGPKLQVIELEGTRARLYDHCHKASRREELLGLGWDEATLDSDLSFLTASNLLIEVDQAFLSLALRPKSELLGALRE